MGTNLIWSVSLQEKKTSCKDRNTQGEFYVSTEEEIEGMQLQDKQQQGLTAITES